MHTGDLRDLDEARAATRRLLARHPPRRDRRRHRELPQAPVHAHRGQRALYNGVVRAALDHDVERFVYVSSSMVFERATQYPTHRGALWDCPMPRSAYGFSKLTGEVYVRAAHDEHGLPYTICRPFNAYGPGEMPEDEPGIAHAVPDLIRKCLALPDGRAAADLRRRHAHADARPTSTTSPTGSSPRWPRRDGRQRGLQHLGERGADGRRVRPDHLGGDRPRPGGVRARAPADVRGRRRPPLAERREGRAAARLAGADRRPRGDPADRRLAARRRRRRGGLERRHARPATTCFPREPSGSSEV